MGRKGKHGRQSQPGNTPFATSLVPYLLLFIVSLTLYGRSIGFPFLGYDDTLLIVDNQSFLQDFRNLPRAFRQDAWTVSGHRSSGSYYRPLYTLSFMLDAQFSGTDPVAYHVSSILLHGLAACLVLTLLSRMGTAPFPALILSLFFCLHPALVSVVAWVPGRNDSLLAVFVLAAVLFLERFAGSRSKTDLLFHFFFLTAAFFTKEAALAFPFLGCVYLVTVGKDRLGPTPSRLLVAGWFLLAAGWGLVRFGAIGPGQLGPGLLPNLKNNWVFLIHYLGKTFLPVRLALFPTQLDTPLLPGLGVLLVLVALGVLRWFARSAVALFGLSWFLLFLLPTLIVPVLVGLEQRLYLPMVGLLLLLTAVPRLAGATTTRRRVAAFSLLLLAEGALTWSRLGAFESRERFWAAAVRASPHSSLALFNLGTVRLGEGRLDEAEDLLGRSLHINPTEPMVHNNLGVLQIRRRRPAEALRYFEKETRINPDYADAWFNLGAAYSQQGQSELAVQFWEKTLDKNPAHQRALRFLAGHYARSGDPVRAAEYLQRLDAPPE